MGGTEHGEHGEHGEQGEQRAQTDHSEPAEPLERLFPGDSEMARRMRAHPAGLLTLWLELDRHRTFGSEDQTLLALLAGTVELPDGRIGIVVGDCVGRGLEAATVMGQLRSACRALLLQATGPGCDPC